MCYSVLYQLKQFKPIVEWFIKFNVEGIAVVYPQADEGMNGFFKVSSWQKWLDLHNCTDLFVLSHTFVKNNTDWVLTEVLEDQIWETNWLFAWSLIDR